MLLLIPYRRFKTSFARQVTAADSRVGESERVPPELRVPNRVFMNLLELPVPFYVRVVAIWRRLCWMRVA
ncbi:hypothetical protein [Zoogloea sp.]|uniref:hypothetical protein n=1 Tax=Zoogloea sp. TaxID=49181 RepID=UPI0035B30018